MGESKGREDEGDAGAGPVPEGSAGVEGSAADSAYGDELPPFPPGRKSAGTLDLAAANDEPTQLIRMLIVAAHEHIDESENSDQWKVLLGHFERANNELARLQAPGPKHGSL